jgi:hypothetical protein
VTSVIEAASVHVYLLGQGPWHLRDPQLLNWSSPAAGRRGQLAMLFAESISPLRLGGVKELIYACRAASQAVGYQLNTAHSNTLSPTGN